MNNTGIKRRNFFFYLGAAGAGVYALTKLPFKIFQQKVRTESGMKVKENPYAVKRDALTRDALTRNKKDKTNG